MSPTAINEMQRMRMIDDALALVLAGYRKPDVFFNLTRFLEHDIDYFPWLAAAKSFKKLRSILKYGDDEERKEKLRVCRNGLPVEFQNADLNSRSLVS